LSDSQQWTPSSEIFKLADSISEDRKTVQNGTVTDISFIFLRLLFKVDYEIKTRTSYQSKHFCNFLIPQATGRCEAFSGGEKFVVAKI
jgi:hypothetical protein